MIYTATIILEPSCLGFQVPIRTEFESEPVVVIRWSVKLQGELITCFQANVACKLWKDWH